jgi:hypothetical protein
MSFLTSFCDLPQNEQRSVSSVRLTITVGDLLELRSNQLLGDNRGVAGNFGTRNYLAIALNALVTNKSTLADHSFGNSGRALGCSRHDVCDLAFRPAAKRAAKPASFHVGNHLRRLQVERAIRGARLPRLLNHIPWPGRRTLFCRARHRARPFQNPGRYAWQ